MPYTPPSPLLTSPSRPRLAAGGPSSSGHGRHHSDSSIDTIGQSSNKKTYSSSSYIYRHRRSPTFSPQTSSLREPEIGARTGRRNSLPSDNTSGSSVWKSPPGMLIPTGGVISPPDSKNNSSDEEERSPNRLEERNVLAELEAAIMSIDQSCIQPSPRKSSPIRPPLTSKRSASPLNLSLALAAEAHEVRGSRSLGDTPKHTRSNSTDGVIQPCSSEIATHTPEDSDRGEDEMDLSTKPSMVRKKSGELVRPAIRLRRRPSSMPGTPTFSKAVHFDAQLEHIRHFLQVDKPLAVSAGSSPVENYDGDTEFPFGMDDSPYQAKCFEWEARIANFPDNPEARKTMPVRLERIFLSSDNKYLVGVVAVANISFQKHVVARFTLDYWKTTSEVVAEYNNDVRRKQANDGYDRFNFSIRLADMGNLEAKRMFICLRYNVNGLEFWDNNSAMNYHIDFSRKNKSKPEKLANSSSGSRAAVALPRSRSAGSAAGRPHSMPSLSTDFKFPSLSPAAPDRHELGKPPRLLDSSSKDDILSDAPIRRNTANPQAFGNRYDFGASLSAVMQPGSAGQTRRGQHSAQSTTPHNSSSRHQPRARSTGDRPSKPESAQPTVAGSPGAFLLRTSSPGPMRSPDHASGNPYHQSPVYKELVDKYCFFGSPKADTQKPNRFSRQSQSTSRDMKPYERSDSVSSDSSISSVDSPVEDNQSLKKVVSPPPPTYTSPTLPPRSDLSSTASSPIPFTHPYHHSMQMALSESPSHTPIRG
ncbi:hypothetical protein FQN52_009546 [Onygenales sp. PD_12]|nr:hypothetical protein FQN52_009546 [Onygenales sp. PD_12]